MRIPLKVCRVRLDADLFSVLKVCARFYSARQLMRFGTYGWTKYFETPMLRRPESYYCCDHFPTPEDRRPILVWPEPSAMQGHWE
jgi:hypothetical protein